MQTYAYGFPRLGRNREFKKVIESFWEKKITDKELVSSLDAIEEQRLSFYKDYVDAFPLGEFTYYDNIFDTALIFGIYKFKNFNEYFDYTRGRKALELRKYFNTNYHYLVPLLEKNARFNLSWNKPLFYFNRFFSFKDNPVFLIGPYTFLKLSRLTDNFDKLFAELCISYEKLFEELKKNGVRSIHIDEPAFCLDVPQKEVRLIIKNYKKIIPPELKINLVTYYESVDFLHDLYDLPVNSLGLDFIAGSDNINLLKKKGFPNDKKLICGVIDAKSPIRANILNKVKFLEHIRKAGKLKEENVLVSNNCPLFHLPITLEVEQNIDSKIKNKISFAKEKLYELNLIKNVYEGKTAKAREWKGIIVAHKSKSVQKVFDTLSFPEKEYLYRRELQQGILRLPLFPTTTIGSFPQDKELRKMRLGFVSGNVSLENYENFIRDKILKLVEKEEDIGLDVLVHGEFERSDMVEFFAQKLKGFLTTDNGWVISYGTRVYRPPIVYGRIEREKPLTLKEIFYAQSLVPKPVKGIFTGPITILAWSYNLREEPIYDVAFELAKALNEEAEELVNKGIKIIQIDEPAIKEYSPLKKRKRDFYFSWAIRSFNITAQLPSKIQIHTHLCYSEFGEIIKWITKMNFDVITIEAAREKANIVDSFKDIKFNRAIGPGVWDIHSKYPAKELTIREILDKSIKTFGPKNVWINPDCGLKTRGWSEVETSLKLITKIAKIYRNKFKNYRG
jgi:5-methyltetrahydropteroyltriglutamate--homocysteine methyltransferase